MLILLRVDEKALLTFTRLNEPFSTTRRLAPFVREQALGEVLREMQMRLFRSGSTDLDAHSGGSRSHLAI